MKPIHYHLINSAIAGGLVFLGSLIPLVTGDIDTRGIILGMSAALVTSGILFLNKFNEWFLTQDPDCPKILNFL